MANRRRGGDLTWHHAHWPDVDRAAWHAINRPGDEFDAPGKAFAWTEASRRNVEHAYGRYLDYLARNGVLRPVAKVGDRLDLGQIKLFAQELATNIAPSTVWGVLQALARAFCALAPEADRTQLNRVLTRVKRRTRLSRQLDGRLVDPVDLFAVARQMLDEAEARTLGKKAAVLYRNGAIIMGAAYCPLRLDAWGKVILGRHLRLVGDQAWIAFEAGELKATTRPFEARLPPDVTVRVARYISRYRPLLLPPAKTDGGALWLTWAGDPLQDNALASAVTKALTKRCGRKFSFHMFRHAAATFIEDHAPEQCMMIAGVLHHADMRMAEHHYIRGQRMAGIRTYQSCIRGIVRKGCRVERKLAERRRKRG